MSLINPCRQTPKTVNARGPPPSGRKGLTRRAPVRKQTPRGAATKKGKKGTDWGSYIDLARQGIEAGHKIYRDIDDHETRRDDRKWEREQRREDAAERRRDREYERERRKTHEQREWERKPVHRRDPSPEPEPVRRPPARRPPVHRPPVYEPPAYDDDEEEQPAPPPRSRPSGPLRAFGIRDRMEPTKPQWLLDLIKKRKEHEQGVKGDGAFTTTFDEKGRPTSSCNPDHQWKNWRSHPELKW